MTDPRNEVSPARREALLGAALELADLCAQTTSEVVSAGFDVSRKADASLVTNADIETDRAFRDRVAERFPDMGVLGEELGEVNPDADFRWVLDPIDGTAEFARHLPVYGCIIGLFYKGEPLLGVIDHRGMGLRTHAAFGLGAFTNGTRLAIEDSDPAGRAAEARIGLPSLSSFLSPVDARAVFQAVVDTFPNFRAYHTCYAHTLVANGGLDASMEWGTPLWDLAATRIIVEEAGGRYISLNTFDVPGDGVYHSAVFGQPAVADRLASIIRGVPV